MLQLCGKGTFDDFFHVYGVFQFANLSLEAFTGLPIFLLEGLNLFVQSFFEGFSLLLTLTSSLGP